jgi:hypothetical protein
MNMFFKPLMKVFSGSNMMVLAIVALILIFLLFSYSETKGSILDRMEGGTPAEINTTQSTTQATTSQQATASQQAPVQTSGNSYASQPVANPSDLLPKDKNSDWASLNPLGINADGFQTPDLLQSGYHIGIDTIGQTLKNPSYDLRSDPIIEKKNISPWNMSTIEPNLARVPLEVGYGSR